MQLVVCNENDEKKVSAVCIQVECLKRGRESYRTQRRRDLRPRRIEIFYHTSEIPWYMHRAANLLLPAVEGRCQKTALAVGHGIGACCTVQHRSRKATVQRL